jgi:hypothetical protein
MHWAYDDTSPAHEPGIDAVLLEACASRAWSWGYVYMANRLGLGWRQLGTNVHRYFAEIYSSANHADDQYDQWYANRAIGDPMLNVLPAAAPDALYSATRRICAASLGGHIGLYVHTVPLQGARLAAVVRALNDCTR